MSIFRVSTILLIVFFLAKITSAESPKREFRGVWIATVNNIDWPSKPGLSAEAMQKELIEILNRLDELHFNAVIFQIRPAGDAFYISATEPWSVWLTGEQGKAPMKNWDPLKFMCDECHKRGMELHAWMNPFRITQNLAVTLSERNVAKRHPDWVLNYGNKLYLDPGIPDVRNYLNNIVGEVVRKYDVDAIHFDDYFYPYPIPKENFPDTMSFRKYGSKYSAEQIADWRRENVDLIIQSLSTTIKKTKPTLKFGISPFGVWRNQSTDPKGSATTGNTTNYDHLYADVLKWQEKGWIDYLIPQIYWEFGHQTADYETLAKWWNEHTNDRHMYIGHALYKAAERSNAAWENENELPNQIELARSLENISGSSFFRERFLDLNPGGFTDKLKTDVYAQKALLPTMPWLDKLQPNPIGNAKIKKDVIELSYSKKQPRSRDQAGLLIYISDSKKSVDIENPENMILFTQRTKLRLSDIKIKNPGRYYLWFTTIDRQHNESEPVGGLKIKIEE